MSLTGFNRLRRLQQEEAMKPENIKKQEEPIVEATPELKSDKELEEIQEKIVTELEEKQEEPIVEEVKTTSRPRRRK